MIPASDDLRQKVEKLAGNPVADIRHFASGNNTLLYLVDTQDKRRLVAKVANAASVRLDIEGWMLEYLAARSNLPVPEVVAAQQNILLMTYLPNSGTLDAGAETQAAELLAALHNLHSELYGLDRDTLIGPLPQPNKQTSSWIDFFRDQRLLYMARAALDENRIDGSLMTQIERLAAKLDSYIDDPAPPSLLHGDIWGGNVLSAAGKITGFIDPAIYYGDPEVELAFATMFNTFGQRFFERYNEINPLRDGFFEVRKDLYNLYPLLVHVRLFGRAYTETVKQTVHRLAA